MKTFTYSTRKKVEFNKAVKKLIDDEVPFKFQKKYLGPNEWFELKIMFENVEVAEKLWMNLNKEFDNAFSLGHRR